MTGRSGRSTRRGGRVDADLAEIDPERLLDRARFDTGVATRAWSSSEHAPSADVRACQTLWEALLEKGHTVLIAAPAVAEMLRARPPHPLPRVAGVEVVPFDGDCASFLGAALPLAETRGLATAERSHSCVKFDAMIVACASRWKASCIVSLDRRTLGKLARRADVELRLPQDFQKPIFQG